MKSDGNIFHPTLKESVQDEKCGPINLRSSITSVDIGQYGPSGNSLLSFEILLSQFE
jgi:hypothetical protein